MINLIIVMILSALSVILVFPKWSKERNKRLATQSYVTCWTGKEIMLYIALVITTSVCVLSLFGIVIIFIIGGFE